MKRIIKLLFAAGVAAAALTSRADTITWNGSVSSSWINPTNWTPQEVPTTNDHVIIASGSVTVPASGTFAILDWSGGTITGPLTVISNAVLNISWNFLTSWNGALTNAGTVNVSGIGQLNLMGGPINNLPGGIIDFKTNQNWSGFPAAFYNAGLVRKTGGTGVTQIGLSGFPINFTNTGTVEADIGTITFNSGGPIDGNYQATNSATINFGLGAFIPGTNPVLSGAGTIKFTGTTLTLPTDVISGLQLLGGTLNLGPAFQGGSITNLTLSGTVLGGTNILTGTLTSGSGGFSGALTVAAGGTFNWTAGASTGPITVLTNGAMNISWGNLTTWNGALTNAGTVTVTGAGQLNMSSGPINNLPGGIIDFQANNNNWTGLTPVTFYNAGLVRKTVVNSTTQVGLSGFPVNFINTGTVEADTGTIIFNSGGQIDGNYQAASGATINFASGTFTTGSPVFSGAGTNKFTGTSLTLPNNLIPGLQLVGGTLNLGPTFQGGTITNLTLPGTTLAGTNTITGTATLGGGFTGMLTVATNAVVMGLSGASSGALTVAGGGTVTWTNGNAYTGSFTVLTNGVLNIDWNVLTVMTGSLTNAGLVNVHGIGQLNLMGGPINNLPGGIIDFKTNQNWTGFPATFYNAGLVRKTGGTGVTQIGVSGFPINFTNTGTVEADIGTIAFNSGGQIDGNYEALGNGTINFASGTFTAINPVFSGTGTNKFTGTILILANNVVPGLQLLGGTVQVGPTFQGGSITNLVLPGITLAGTNTVTGTAILGGGFSGVLTVASNAVVTGLTGISQGALTVAGGATVSCTNGNAYTGSFTVLTNGVLNIDWNVLTVMTGSLTNAGLVNVHGIGQLNLMGGPINNLPGGIIDFKTNQNWTGFPATFYNAGLVRKTGGTGVTQIGVSGFPINFTNTGTVEADIGTIAFNSGGQIDGNYEALGNGTINFASGTFTAINPVFSGTGTNKFTGTILILANNVVPGLQLLGGTVQVGPTFQGGSITNLVLPGITLAGTNTVTGTAILGGGFSGVLTVASNGVATGTGGTSVGSLIVAGGGTFNWTNGAIGNSITVLANGVLNIQWNVLTYLNGSLTNAGLVTVTGNGQMNLDAGPINNLAGGVIDFKTNSTWTGFPATFYNAGLVRKTGGTGISQLGISSFPITFVNTTGTVEADTGIINFNAGGYSDTSSAHISISLGGATSGTGYGLISFTAPPLLNATLAASTRNGFVPSPGQTFKVLSYPSSTNQFNCISGLDLGGGILLQPQFSSTGLTLLTSAYSVSAVLPQLFINPSLGGVALTWPASFSGWTLQSTTNLALPAWIAVPSTCGNEALVTGAPPLFFRLKN